MIPKIKRYKDSLYPDRHWVVMTDTGWDLCKTLCDAIRYWLWHCGVPAKIAFWGTFRPRQFGNLENNR